MGRHQPAHRESVAGNGLSVSTMATRARTASRGASPGTPPAGEGVRTGVMRVRSLLSTGHRRGGRRWGPVAELVDAADFSEAELLALAEDPHLQIVFEEA